MPEAAPRRRESRKAALRAILRAWPLLAIWVAGWGVVAPAQADVYGYLDTQGVAHFAAEKLDDRYQLFLRGDHAFDSAQLLADGPAAPPSRLAAYLTGHPGLKRYGAMVRAAAREFAVDPALLTAVMAAESGFDPHAVSGKGAIGLMQVLPATAERYGLVAERGHSLADRLTDPQTNIRLGARALRDLLRRFPQQLDLVLAAYNAGEGAVQRYGNRVPPFAETRGYVRVVTQFLQMYRRQGIDGAGARTAAAPSVALAGGSGIGVGGASGGSGNVRIAGDADGVQAARRIHLTIPGRGDMPGTGPDVAR